MNDCQSHAYAIHPRDRQNRTSEVDSNERVRKREKCNVAPRKAAAPRGHRAHLAVPAVPRVEGDGPLRLQVVGGVRSGQSIGIRT